jgi:phosphoserine phosphatase
MRSPYALVSWSRRKYACRVTSASNNFLAAPTSVVSSTNQKTRVVRPTFSSTARAFSQGFAGMNIPSSIDLPTPPIGQNVEAAIQALLRADAVCFDVDSTVIDEEGIDVLAEHLGKGQQVSELTLAAMEGGMKFQEALAARLNLLEPSQQAIMECLEAHPLKLTSGMADLVQVLADQGKHVYLVSGGFRIMIEPVADVLGINPRNIYANTILFDDAGKYAGFDTNEPTSADMGKPKALEIIKKLGNYETMIMIGDGATDAQAKPPANAFIGFGGVAVREKVKKVADWFVTDFSDLLQVLQYNEK